MFDLTVAAIATLLTAPLVFVLAIGSAVTYRAWPFFTQERVGRGGRPFTCVKLRTLPTHAPRDADRPTIDGHVHHSWGRFLRNSHLDELPQFWCVLIGTMSVIGPRPIIPEHSAAFDQEFVHERTTVRPGVSGLWQLSAFGHEPIDAHPEFDTHYVLNRSLRLDLWILLRTMTSAVVKARGVSLDQIPRWTGAARRCEESPT